MVAIGGVDGFVFAVNPTYTHEAIEFHQYLNRLSLIFLSNPINFICCGSYNREFFHFEVVINTILIKVIYTLQI